MVFENKSLKTPSDQVEDHSKKKLKSVEKDVTSEVGGSGDRSKEDVDKNPDEYGQEVSFSGPE